MRKIDMFLYKNIWVTRFLYWLTLVRKDDIESASDILMFVKLYDKFPIVIMRFFSFFYLKLFFIFFKYNSFLKGFYWFLNSKPKEVLYNARFRDINSFKIIKGSYYIQKGFKYKNLGIYLKNLVHNNNDLYSQNLKNMYKSYCYLLIRLNRKNLFLTLLSNEGNVLCKTNIGASGFKKKVKRTGYAIKGTGKNFIKKIKKSLIKSIFMLYKKDMKNIDYNFQNKFEKLKLIKDNKKIIIKKKRKKIKKKINKSVLKTNYLKANSRKIIRSKLSWIKLSNNLNKYRAYYYPNLSNLIKKNLRIIFRIRTSLKLWAFRFVVYGLFKKLPWFRGIEFRLPVAHSKGLRLKKKRRV